MDAETVECYIIQTVNSKLSTVRRRAITWGWRSRRRSSDTLVSVVPWRSPQWPRELKVAIATDDASRGSSLQQAFADPSLHLSPIRMTPEIGQLIHIGPDAIVIDCSSHLIDQVQLTGQLSRLPGAPAVVVLREHEADMDHAVATLNAGASALLPRDATPHELRQAIECVLRGEAVVPPEVAAHVVRALQAADRR
jgi:DNA-binding NarL/FixJ family response regulator